MIHRDLRRRTPVKNVLHRPMICLLGAVVIAVRI